MANRTCSLDECDRPVFSRGWCNSHYKRNWRYGSPTAGGPMRERGDACSVPDCERPYYGREYCNFHWLRWRRHGDPEIDLARPVRVGVDPCAVDGCDGVMKAHNVCVKHLHRLYRHGSPVARVRGEVVNGKRICVGCDVDTPVGDFILSGSYCYPCAAQKRRDWVKSHPTPKRPKHECLCEHCGKSFSGNKQHFRFCSDECRVIGERLRYISGRRAKLAGGVVEKFAATDIFDRDGWVCQLCASPLDKTGVPSGPLWPSVDHIVPVSRGGHHTLANCQSAHMSCNMRKHNKLMSELDLPLARPAPDWPTRRAVS